MTTIAATQPLSAEDFDALDDELDALRQHDEGTPVWDFCEGFLAALVCTRREIPPEEYWPALLGPDFNPMEHMEFVWRWKRRWAEVEAALDAPVESLEDERTYEPALVDVRGLILAQPEDERGDMDIAQLPSYGQMWAIGFLYAVEHWADDWASPRDEDSAGMLDDALSDIAVLADGDHEPATTSLAIEDGPPSVSEQRLDDFAMGIWAVYDLRQLWKSLGPRIDPIRREAVPGRNDPCPCGSGKKYKKCHGAA